MRKKKVCFPRFNASIRRLDALLAHYASQPAVLDALNALVILDGEAPQVSASGSEGLRDNALTPDSNRVSDPNPPSKPTLTSLVLAHLRAERGRARPVPTLTLEEMFDRKLSTYQPEQIRAASTMRRAKRVFCSALGGDMQVAEISPDMVRGVLGKFHSAATRNHLLINFKTAANLAKKQRLLGASPADGIAPERVEWKEPSFFLPERVARIMRIAEAHPGAVESGVGAFLALGFFAGVRTAEILRAEWEDIDLVDCTLRVPKPKGWTRGTKPRIVELEKNAVTWLTLWRNWTEKHGRKATGRIVRDAHDIQHWKALRLAPKGLSWGARRIRGGASKSRKAGAIGENGTNIPRHTYATMHVAAFRKASATALNLGHSGGTRILEKHYRGLISQASAAPYWEIMPKREPAPPEPRPGRGHRTDLDAK